MRCVSRGYARCVCRDLRSLIKVLVIGGVHRLAHPLSRTLGGDCVSHFAQPLGMIRDDMAGTVLVGHDGNDRNLA